MLRKGSGMPISVLIADDESELVEGWGLLLREMGYEDFSDLDGEQAVAIAHERGQDVMILDINMPKKSGEQVLEELSKAGLKTKVIISTGQAGSDQSMKNRVIKKFPVAAFLEKPTTIQEMDYVIKEVLKEA